jgi:hypothetical protein
MAPKPAQLTTMSSEPNVSRAARIAPSTWFSSDTSVMRPAAQGPSSRAAASSAGPSRGNHQVAMPGSRDVAVDFLGQPRRQRDAPAHRGTFVIDSGERRYHVTRNRGRIHLVKRGRHRCRPELETTAADVQALRLLTLHGVEADVALGDE